MFQIKVKGPIDTVHCPYNHEHIMPKDSLLNHLYKCKATNKHLFGKCRYNSFHIYPKIQLENHERVCKSKKIFQKEQNKNQSDWSCEENQEVYQNSQKKPISIKQKPIFNQSIIKGKLQSSNGFLSDDADILMSDDQFSQSQNQKQKVSISSSDQLKSVDSSQKEKQKNQSQYILNNQEPKIQSYQQSMVSIQNNSSKSKRQKKLRNSIIKQKISKKNIRDNKNNNNKKYQDFQSEDI